MRWLNDKPVADALEKIKFHSVAGSSIERIEQSYLMLSFAVQVSQEIEKEHKEIQDNLFASFGEGPSDFTPEQTLVYNKLQNLRFKIEVMIRSVYENATIHLGLLGAEAQKDLTIFDCSIKAMARSNPALLSKVDPVAVAAAWSVSEYRNKLIAHHDFTRTYSFVSGGGGCRLEPHEPQMKSPTNISGMWAQYGAITANPAEINHRAQAKLLFEAIPVLSTGSFNPDRKAIDLIAEEFGLQSNTTTEVLEKVKIFTLELAKVV